MNMKRVIRNKRYVIVATAVVLASGTVAALTSSSPPAQGVDSPLVQQVNNHEGRITDLEKKTDDTQTQTNQNSADIHNLQDNTGTAPAAPVSKVSTPVTTSSNTSSSTAAPETTSAPAQSPTPAPRTITNVSDTPGSNGLHTCHYTLYDSAQNAKQGPVIQPNSMPCQDAGTVLPY